MKDNATWADLEAAGVAIQAAADKIDCTHDAVYRALLPPTTSLVETRRYCWTSSAQRERADDVQQYRRVLANEVVGGEECAYRVNIFEMPPVNTNGCKAAVTSKTRLLPGNGGFAAPL